MCLVHPVVDERNGMLVAVGVLDNLVKGAAGQAIENMNLMLGLATRTRASTCRRCTREPVRPSTRRGTSPRRRDSSRAPRSRA